MRYGFACALIATVVCGHAPARPEPPRWDDPPPAARRPARRHRRPPLGLRAQRDYRFNESGRLRRRTRSAFEVLGGYRFNPAGST